MIRICSLRSCYRLIIDYAKLIKDHVRLIKDHVRFIIDHAKLIKDHVRLIKLILNCYITIKYWEAIRRPGPHE